MEEGQDQTQPTGHDEACKFFEDKLRRDGVDEIMVVLLMGMDDVENEAVSRQVFEILGISEDELAVLRTKSTFSVSNFIATRFATRYNLWEPFYITPTQVDETVRCFSTTAALVGCLMDAVLKRGS